MPVYLIRAGNKGPVKIGYSDDVAVRLSKIQADNHERLTILRLLEGGVPEEAMLHAKFADDWLHGEWFTFSKAMLGDLGLQEAAMFTTPEAITKALRKLARDSRAAAALRPPEPPPTAAQEALLSARYKQLAAVTKARIRRQAEAA